MRILALEVEKPAASAKEGIMWMRIFNLTQFRPLVHPVLQRVLIITVLLLGLSPPIETRASGSTTHTVCPIGCDFTSIQAAIDAANPGDAVRVETPVAHTENNISVNKSVDIEGLGMTLTTVQGAITAASTPNPVFHIMAGVIVTIKDLTVRHGGVFAISNPGGIFNDGGDVTLERVRVQYNHGQNIAGIKNQGTMVINDSQIDNNMSTGGAGGIRNENVLVINNSKVAHNSSMNQGGGIFNSGNLILQDSTISENAGSTGGGIFISGGSTEISRSTIHSNSAEESGGGLWTGWPEVSLTNVTISGNMTPGNGGGIYIDFFGDITLANVTISDNTADNDDSGGGDGGGIYIGSTEGVRMKNSIVAGNHDLSNFFLSRARDCDGLVDSDGYNLIGTLSPAISGTHCTVGGNTTGNQIEVNAELGSLQDNGGPTLTHALLPGSPAINAGNPAECTDYDANPVVVDQRGGKRLDRCDVGSYELDALLNHIYLPIVTKP